jgi:hypothetical protein
MAPSGNPRIHVLRFGLRGWAAIGAAAAVLVAAAILAVGLLLFLLPLLLLASVLYFFLPRRPLDSIRKDMPGGPAIIDGEFHVVGAGEIEEKGRDGKG